MKILLTVLTIVMIHISPCQADIYVVVHAGNTVEKISIEDLRELYLAQKRTFSNGEAVRLYSVENSKLKNAFLEKVIKMPSAQFDAYWARLVFAGRILPINEVNDSDSLIAEIEMDPSGVGFLDQPPKSEKLKTLLVLAN